MFLCFNLQLVPVCNTLLGHILQIIDNGNTMAVTDELGQVLVKTGVLEVDIGNAFFSFFVFLISKTFLDDMLFLQAC